MHYIESECRLEHCHLNVENTEEKVWDKVNACEVYGQTWDGEDV